MRIVVDRCICAQITFVQLKQLTEPRSLSFEQLQDTTGCCSQCAMCEPYVRLMLETGHTAFTPLTQAQIDDAMSRPRP